MGWGGVGRRGERIARRQEAAAPPLDAPSSADSVRGAIRHHSFRPCKRAFHAAVSNGSWCQRQPDPAGPTTSHILSSSKSGQSSSLSLPAPPPPILPPRPSPSLPSMSQSPFPRPLSPLRPSPPPFPGPPAGALTPTLTRTPPALGRPQSRAASSSKSQLRCEGGCKSASSSGGGASSKRYKSSVSREAGRATCTSM